MVSLDTAGMLWPVSPWLEAALEARAGAAGETRADLTRRDRSGVGTTRRAWRDGMWLEGVWLGGTRPGPAGITKTDSRG